MKKLLFSHVSVNKGLIQHVVQSCYNYNLTFWKLEIHTVKMRPVPACYTSGRGASHFLGFGRYTISHLSALPSSCDHCGCLFFKNASMPSCESLILKFRSIISSPHLNERQEHNIILIQRMYTDKDKTIILSIYKQFLYIHKDNIGTENRNLHKVA